MNEENTKKQTENYFKEHKIIDTHCHIFPPKIFERIWKFFEHNYWHVNYKYNGDAIVKFLEKEGVDYFTTLNYAHKPNISHEMNQYIVEFYKKYPQSIPLGTIHPSDKDLINIAERALTSQELLGFKIQLLVTDFYLFDKRLDPVFKLIEREDKILVVHAGSGPLANPYVGYKNFEKFIKKHPSMKIQVAHLGCYEYSPFFKLLDEYPNLYMDNAMILVDHNLFPANFDLNYETLLEYEDRLMYGTDFPNIPYDFKNSYTFIFELDFPKSFYEKFFFKNAQTFYRI